MLIKRDFFLLIVRIFKNMFNLVKVDLYYFILNFFVFKFKWIFLKVKFKLIYI